jgi:hypothetical protein
MKKIYICGSFKNYKIMQNEAARLKKSGAEVLISKPDKSEGIKGCLNNIDSAEIVYVVNPDGRIGKSVSLDIGYAIAKGRKIISMKPIDDPPVGEFMDPDRDKI